MPLTLAEICRQYGFCILCLNKEEINKLLADKKINQRQAKKLFRVIKRRDKSLAFRKNRPLKAKLCATGGWQM